MRANRNVSTAPRGEGTVIAEVIAEGMPLQRPGRVEVQVRLVEKELRVGSAQLISRSGLVREVNILGVHFYDGRPSETVDPFVLWIGIEGITPADVELGQIITQEGIGAHT